jgi:2-hydroxychromene-2-carboxylate isomerase
MAKVIDYYMTHSSPWTYLGHERFAAIAKAAGASVNLKPADYGKVFAVSGGLPLKQRPMQRQAYRMTELKRWRAHLKVELNLEPKYFPVDANPAALLTIAALNRGTANATEAAMRLTGAIMRACWVEERNIADPDTLAAIADAQGLDGAALLALSQQPQTRATYEQFIADAIAAQVFGAPTYIYKGELFWGQDRLDFLERALQQAD